MNGGVLGAVVGLGSGAAAIALNVWIHRRQGDPEPLRSVLGLRPQGIERAIYGQGAKIAFPVYVVVVTLYLLGTGDFTAAGVLDGCAGVTYGLSCAWVALRLGR